MSISLPRRSAALPTAERAALLGMRRLRLLHRALVYALLLGLAAIFLLPFLWMLSTSLKPQDEVFAFPPTFIPTSFEWHNYRVGWTVLPFTSRRSTSSSPPSSPSSLPDQIAPSGSEPGQNATPAVAS